MRAALASRAFYRLHRPWAGPAPCTAALQDNGFTVTPATRRRHAISLLQAAEESPNLSQLVERIQASSARLSAVRGLLPAALRNSVQAGPIEDGQWCLLVSSNAAAAKLRQLLPELQQMLLNRGMPVASIRIRVQGRKEIGRAHV